MRFYVASNFANWPAAKELQQQLEIRGNLVTSHWIDIAAKRNGADGPQPEEKWAEVAVAEAVRDVQDVDAAEALVLIEDSAMPPTRGALFELGYAHGKGKLCVVVGEADHVFHYHPDFISFKDGAEFLEWVERVGAHEEIIFRA